MQGYQRARHYRDKSNELETIGKQVISDDRPELKALNILYAWRSPPRYDQQRNRVVQGECKRLSNRERDLFGFDCCIIIAKKIWKELSAKQKYRLMYHELKHLSVELDDTGKPEVDDHNRVKIRILKHDMNLERFEDEIRKFGPDSQERVFLKKVSRLYHDFKKAHDTTSS